MGQTKDPQMGAGLTAANDDNKTKPVGSCPICKKGTQEKWRPFCSNRCANIDLSRWLTGSYTIPVADDDDDEDGDDPGAEIAHMQGGEGE